MTLVSKRQFLLSFGMNSHTFSKLVAKGTIKVHVTHGARSSITVMEHSLVEGEHFVRCLECGSHQGMIAPRHLKMCCGLTIEQYVGKHPASNLMSSFCTANKTKTRELECDIHRDLNACIEQVMEVVRVRRANQDPTSLCV